MFNVNSSRQTLVRLLTVVCPLISAPLMTRTQHEKGLFRLSGGTLFTCVLLDQHIPQPFLD